MAYEIPILPNINGCIYKLWYLNKYIIVKCKTLFRSKENIESGLKYFFKNTPKGRKETDYFHLFFVFVLDNPFNDFSIEIIFESENPLELLKREFLEKQKAKSDENCLNNSFDVYVPKNTQVNGKKSWINRGYYLNFMQWRLKYLNQNKIG